MYNNKTSNVLDILLNNKNKEELKIEVYLNKIILIIAENRMLL